MTLREDGTTPVAGAADQKDFEEIVEQAEILFEHPNMVPGKPARSLSPREMFAATHEPRLDQTQDELLWLTETPLNAIDKDGIDLLRRTYTGLDVMPLTTGRKNELRRDLVMRYNRAELARGVLKEIVILQRDPRGVYTEVGRAQRSDVFRQDTDYSSFLRARARYIDELIGKVKLDREAYVRLETGSEMLDELVAAIQARERFQRRQRPGPIVSRPEWEDSPSSSPEADADYDAMMKGRPEAASAGVDGVAAELRLADIIAGSEGANSAARKTGKRDEKLKKKGSGSKRAKKSATPGRAPIAPDLAPDDEAAHSPPLAGGSAGLADLLGSMPIPADDDR